MDVPRPTDSRGQPDPTATPNESKRILGAAPGDRTVIGIALILGRGSVGVVGKEPCRDRGEP